MAEMLKDELFPVKLNSAFNGVGVFYKYVGKGSLVTRYTVNS